MGFRRISSPWVVTSGIAAMYSRMTSKAQAAMRSLLLVEQELEVKPNGVKPPKGSALSEGNEKIDLGTNDELVWGNSQGMTWSQSTGTSSDEMST